MSTNLSPIHKIGIDARLWNETGVGRYIRNLVAELQKLDKQNEYVLFVLSKDAIQVQSTIINNKWSIKNSDIHWHTMEEQLQFGKLLENEKLDLVHFPYFSVPIFYKGKFVLTIHDLILHQFPTGKASTKSAIVYWVKHAAYKYVIGKAAKKAEKIITVSHATKDEIIKRLHLQSSKIVVTYEGVDEKVKSSKLEVTSSIGKYFLYVGNAYPHKNLEKLVEAMSLVLQRGPAASHPQNSLPSHSFSPEEFRGSPSRVTPFDDIKLILVGKEDFFYSRLEKRVKELDLSEVILFKHQVRDEELANLYKNALALVMPSLMEGFGLPVIEAMQQQCLVAISDIPVFHEIAKNAAIYFNPQDVQAIKNVLESIAKGDVPDESEKKKIGKEITGNFSWKKMAEETQKVYKSCIDL